MTLTTGAILRRITEVDLSAASHKLATIILDGIAWKDGDNGLERGTAAFTLAHLAEKMGMSRQHLTHCSPNWHSPPLILFVGSRTANSRLGCFGSARQKRM